MMQQQKRGSPTDSSFKLWVLGDVAAKGTIYIVFLSAAFATNEAGTITITPTTTSMVTDPTAPDIPTAGPMGVGTIPLTGDGSPLPSHGIDGPGTSRVSSGLGDFMLTDSLTGACSFQVPTTFPDNGQINVYDITVTGYSSVHFDAFDHYVSVTGGLKTNNGKKASTPRTGTTITNHYAFAPCSHDGQGTPVPEPATLFMMGLGLIGLAFARVRK